MDKDTKNYYEVLEIPTDASSDEIQQAYHRSKNAYSGDSVALYSLMTEDECKQVLESIQEAYDILSQNDKRREYDKARGLNQVAARSGSNTNKSVTFFEEKKNPFDSFFERKDLPRDSSNEKTQNDFSNQRYQAKDADDHFNINRKETVVAKVTAQNRFALSYNSNAQFDQEIENITNWNGEMIKKVREYKKVDMARMVEMTKISKTYINNIENDEFEKLPAAVYTRGFVYQIAKVLKLNPDVVASSYVSHFKQNKK
ncbi:MAG: helix-turn-helix domain-containing protein [Bacteriovoracaceae bacterium]